MTTKCTTLTAAQVQSYGLTPKAYSLLRARDLFERELETVLQGGEIAEDAKQLIWDWFYAGWLARDTDVHAEESVN